jgi:hypothetical protein
MGTFNNKPIDFSAIKVQMASTMRSWMNGSIQIVDPNSAGGTWNEWTNTETGGEPTVLWSGPARIQHLKNDSSVSIGYSDTSIRGIRIQVPLDVEAGFVRAGLQVIVTDGGNDYELEQLQFVITSAINSSYAWGRTIEATVDVKSIANSTWSGIAGSVVSGAIAISGATVRTFHHEDNLWIMDYETTTDSLGNYELPADAGIPITVVASASSYVTDYYDGANGFDFATTVTPENHVEMQGINFDLVAI